mmetsp:Transcript_6592/g.10102  ORF Transcript_6592/g.10102 Transcript_6592/m.10102 type:complete len:307 (-) Transcript_6592:1347-2267(-)
MYASRLDLAASWRRFSSSLVASSLSTAMDTVMSSGVMGGTARPVSATLSGMRKTRRRWRILGSAGVAVALPSASVPLPSAAEASSAARASGSAVTSAGTSPSSLPSAVTSDASSSSRRRRAAGFSTSSAASASAAASLVSPPPAPPAAAPASSASSAPTAPLPPLALWSGMVVLDVLGGVLGGGFTLGVSLTGGGTSTMSTTSTWYSAFSMNISPLLSTAKCALIFPVTLYLSAASGTPVMLKSATLSTVMPGGRGPAVVLWYTVKKTLSVALGMDTMRRTGKRLYSGSSTLCSGLSAWPRSTWKL